MDNKEEKSLNYSRGVLDGRYIDWYSNGNSKLDGLAMDGEKKGLWWNGIQMVKRKRKGCGRMVRQTELKSGIQMEKTVKGLD